MVGAVAADDHEGIDAALSQVVGCQLLTFRGHHFLTASGLQNRTAAMDDVPYAAQVHLPNVVMNKAIISALNAIYLQVVIQSAADNRTNSGIHALGIAAAGQDGYGTNRHNEFLL
ncbi:hypothetical protein D3C75_1011140 [compost metagenome]